MQKYKKICSKWEKQRGESVRSEKCLSSSSWPASYPDPDISFVFTSLALLQRVVLSSSLGCLQHFRFLIEKLDVRRHRSCTHYRLLSLLLRGNATCHLFGFAVWWLALQSSFPTPPELWSELWPLFFFFQLLLFEQDGLNRMIRRRKRVHRNHLHRSFTDSHSFSPHSVHLIHSGKSAATLLIWTAKRCLWIFVQLD